MPFKNPKIRRLVLQSPNGARIELDADSATINMYGNDGSLLAQLDAAQEFFGDSVFNFKILDSLGIVRTQISGLLVMVAGDDGTIRMSAGSSGVDNSKPQIRWEPTGYSDYGYMLGKGEADNGAALYITSPAYNNNDQSSVFLFAENDTDPSHVDINAGVFLVNADGIVTGTLDVGSNIDITGDLVASGDTFLGGNLDIGTKEHGFGRCVVNDFSPNLAAGSTTFATIPNVSTGTYTKQRANTGTRCFMSGSGFASTALTSYELGLNLNNGGGFNTTVAITKLFFNPNNTHLAFPAVEDEAAFAGLAAGTYTVTAMYRRSGAIGGNLNMNADDLVSFRVEEVPEL